MTKKTVRFVSSARGQKLMTVALPEGRSAEEVLALLNEGKVILGGDPLQSGLSMKTRIILPEGNGMTVIADCEISNATNFAAWEILPDEPRNCCTMSAEDRARNEAYHIAMQAHEASEAGKLPLARALVKAARALVRSAGSGECEAMVAVLTSEASVATKSGRHISAIGYARRAHQLCERLLTEDNPSRMVCYANIGEALLEGGRVDEARPYLEEALTYFRALKPIGGWSREWIDTELISFWEKLLASAATRPE
jgi:tetratricopeptide (TPR) repeat protein